MLDRKYQPALSWFADGGLINNEPRNLYQNFGLSFGLSMTLPVFDGNQRKINYNKIRMHEETRKYYLDNLRVRYQTQVSQLKDELKNTRLLMKENEKQVALLHELIAANLALVNTGSASITAYILSLQNLIEAKYAGLRYQIRVQYVINELNFWRQ
ncbi:MAG: TolC family protein [Bacteroidetes bacterium]|nr:TolC family protein [Bacteroidota bacterium]